MTDTLTPGSLCESTTTGRRAVVVPTPNGLLPNVEGMFVLDTGTPDFPIFTFAVLSGRTRRQWGMACPTVERFAVDTVVRRRADGVDAIFGVPGDRIPGTFVTRPENVVAS